MEYKLKGVSEAVWDKFTRIASAQNRTIKGALLTAIQDFNRKYESDRVWGRDHDE